MAECHRDLLIYIVEQLKFAALVSATLATVKRSSNELDKRMTTFMSSLAIISSELKSYFTSSVLHISGIYLIIWSKFVNHGAKHHISVRFI